MIYSKAAVCMGLIKKLPEQILQSSHKNKRAGVYGLELYLKGDPKQVFSEEFCKHF